MSSLQKFPHTMRVSQLYEVTIKVEVRATLLSAGRMDFTLEQVVGRLSLESGVSAVSWGVVGQESE